MKSLGAIVVVVALSVGGQVIGRLIGGRLQRRAINGPALRGANPGQTIIAVPRGYWVLCILLAMIAALFIIAAIASGHRQLEVIGPMVSALSGGGALLMAHDLRLRIVLDDEGLLGQGPWQRPLRLHWTNISTVTFSSILTSFTVRDHEGKKLRVPVLGRGSGTMMEQLMSRVAEPIWRHAFEDYRRTIQRST